jgi:hypothetical protein
MVQLTFLCKKDLEKPVKNSVLDIFLKKKKPSPSISLTEMEAAKAFTKENLRLGLSKEKAQPTLSMGGPGGGKSYRR